MTIKFNGFSQLVNSNSGKPYEGKPHVRFDEGSRETGYIISLRPCPTLQINFRRDLYVYG